MNFYKFVINKLIKLKDYFVNFDIMKDIETLTLKIKYNIFLKFDIGEK